MTSQTLTHRCAGLAIALACAWAPAEAQTAAGASALSGTTAQATARAERTAAVLAQELAKQCPVAAPGDQQAFDNCRQGLFHGVTVRENLSTIVLWGRQRDPLLSLKDTSLTQFAPDVLTGMYLPLFMFNGQHEVRYVEREGLYQIRLQTAFRNRLAPGQFPYPFWHDADKWSMYQNANEIIFWWNPSEDAIKVAQFTRFGPRAPLLAVDLVTPPTFDGQWMWTDAQGRTQPKVTVFDGLFKPNNPYVASLDGAYKTLALRLREGQCNECHVASNPNKSKRLVLLQTPAHAGAEVRRLIESVRTDRMPRDETGIEQPLGAHLKADLLRDSEAFAQLYDAAKAWEHSGASTVSKPGQAVK